MKLAVNRRNEQNDALTDNFASGKFRIYSGTRPTDADTALSGNTLLVELTMGATAFPASSAGVLTANSIASGTAVATGTASFVRVMQSDGTTVICDMAITATGGGGEIQIATLSIVTGAVISISSLTITNPVGT